MPLSKIYSLSILVLSLFLLGCVNKIKDKAFKQNPITINTLLNSALGQRLRSIDSNVIFKKNYIIEDSIVEDEDISWKVVILKDSLNNIKAILETNWEDSTIISRIRILSADIPNNDYHVGDSFKRIMNEIDIHHFNEYPDGYSGFISKNDSRICFLMDLPFSSPLTKGISSIKDMPQDIKIKEIILIMHR